MATQVKLISGSWLTATVKRHIIAVVDAKAPEYFGRRLKVGNISMMVESLGDSKYKVTQYDLHNSMISAGKYETSSEYIVQIVRK
jgi:hypothetical protein